MCLVCKDILEPSLSEPSMTCRCGVVTVDKNEDVFHQIIGDPKKFDDISDYQMRDDNDKVIGEYRSHDEKKHEYSSALPADKARYQLIAKTMKAESKKEKLTIEVKASPPDWDNDRVFFRLDGKQVGYGFRSKESGEIRVMHCPNCGRENYAIATATGKCAWCGFHVGKDGEDSWIKS